MPAMKSILGTASLVLGTTAARLPRDSCCFSLSASGGQSGTVGQLSDGQNRVGGNNPAGSYCIGSDGGITDDQGRGCILTPPTTQFQCDVGATPTTGFSVGSNGELQSNGSGKFYACPASDDQYNIYTSPVEGQTKCVEITLNTGGQCASGQPAQSSQAPSSYAPAESQPAPSASQSYPAPAPSSSQPASQPQPPQSYPAPGPSQPAPQPYPSPSAPQSYSAPQVSTSTEECSTTQETSKPVTQPQPVPSTYPVPESSTKASPPAPQTYTSQQPTIQTSQPTPYPSPSTKAPQPSTYPSQSTPASSQPSKPAQTSSSACPTNLSGQYQAPHYIIPINSESPASEYETSYNGQINSTTSSIFTFDIPQSYEGKQCSLVFLFPEKKDLETSDFTLTGSGSIKFSKLSKPASGKVSYQSAPSVSKDLDSIAVQPGNSYVVSTGQCQAGTSQSYKLSSSGGLGLQFFEDYNPSPIGLYITTC